MQGERIVDKEKGVDAVLWSELIPGGHHWSGRLGRGLGVRLTAMGQGANATVLLLNDDDRSERYNMADTLKSQHTGRLGLGHTLQSDMGRVLAAIVAESVTGHDPLCGPSTAEGVARQFGIRGYGEARNAMTRNGRDGLLVELAKWGLGREDLVTPINFFSAVKVGAEGRIMFLSDHAGMGDFVEWTCAMNLLCVVSTAPHPLDTKTGYAPAGVQITAYREGQDTTCSARLCPENGRAFLNTARYFGG